MPVELLAWLIPLPPVLAFFAILLFTNRSNRLSHFVAVGAMLISWAMGMALFITAVTTEGLAQHPITSAVPWLPTGTSWIEFGILVDPLTAVTLFFVVWTCLAIFVYSIGYHNYRHRRDPADKPGLPPHAGGIDPIYARFFAFIALFAFGMLVLVLADNLLLLFMGWEIMGLCSYLLIGFWFAKDSAKRAAVKAFMTTRVGDVFFLLGIAYLYSATGTLNFRAILNNEEVLHQLASTPAVLGLSAAALIGILIFIGTVGKSAQFPLHVWLPDAMEGPTPVSAMIHAATMVSAGVYLLLRMFPLLTVGFEPGGGLTTTMTVIAVIGTFTAIFSATIAVAQNDVKRVLAYSTISQLGFMVAAVGIGAFVAATFHLITHAFFKALLFLGSGSVIHGMEHGIHKTQEHVDPQDMLNMGGLRKRMPITFWTFLLGGLSLAGFPIVTAGFWSKDEILGVAHAQNPAVFVVLALAALLTAFYTMRQISLTFLGQPRTSAAEHAHESAWTMTAPLILLAFFAVTVGWVGIKGDFPVIGGLVPPWIEEFLASMLAAEGGHAAGLSFVPLLTSLVVSLGGLGVGWLIYRRITAEAGDPLVR
ncbi:MAG: NADH-quinone oxidoreductase subunit L, partial [Anaerolineales bacterium]|nr:NADH-quinone oxidoreductase subunit L [Anaerolineales bacterium]